LGAPVASNVVGIALAVLLLIVRIAAPPLLVAVTAYLPVFRIGSVLAAVVLGLTAPLAIRRGTDLLARTDRGRKKLLATVATGVGLSDHLESPGKGSRFDSQA
jgi:ABC-type glucose/galactose transport system permease subunit